MTFEKECAMATLKFMDDVGRLGLSLLGIDNIPSGLDKFASVCKLEPPEKGFVNRLVSDSIAAAKEPKPDWKIVTQMLNNSRLEIAVVGLENIEKIDFGRRR